MSHRAPGLVLTEHEFEVPLDHARPAGRHITVFAREVADPDGLDKPLLVFFQGGPGFEASRPTGSPRGPGWLDRALEDYRVLLLDQRGTGRSTPVGVPPGTPAEQADYLAHFRADSIVRDAEHIRAALGGERWSVLGQSFGGLCVTTYLSLHPEGLTEAFVTGGLPPLEASIDDVYRATYARMRERNRRYFERFPEDHDRVRFLLARLTAQDVRLPTGDRLTGRRLRTLGNLLGMSDGPEALHYILELPPDSPGFLHDAADHMGLARNPLYAILHEACWANGQSTRWAAERMLPADFAELLTGEHIFGWMFEEFARAGAAARGRVAAGRARVAGALRRGRAAVQPGPGRRRDLHGRPLRRARVLRGDRGDDQGPAAVGDERVRPQRPARRRRAHPRPADRPRARARLSMDLRERLAQLEEEHATLRGELHAFESDYLRRVGVVAVQVQELEARILALVAARSGTPDDQVAAAAAEQRFRETTTALRAVPVPAGPPPTEDIKTLFRDAAKRMHPDLVHDAAGRGHAEAFMKRLNDAYRTGDADAIGNLVRQWETSPYAVAAPPGRGDPAAPALQAAIAHAEQRLDEARASELAVLMEQAFAVRFEGRDLLAELRMDAEAALAAARERLTALETSSSP